MRKEEIDLNTALELLLKSQITVKIYQIMYAKRIPKIKLAEIFGIPIEKVYDLMKGRLKTFTMDEYKIFLKKISLYNVRFID